MRKANFFFGLLAAMLLVSCWKDAEQSHKILPVSTGKINTVSVVIDDVLWNGEIGDTLRKKLAAPVDGLQEEEPLFTINQFSPKIFDASVKLSRNIIVISKSDQNEFKHVENQYATPQNVFYISGYSLREIIAILELHASTLVSSLKFYEIIENQRLNAASLFNDKRVKDHFGFTFQVPIDFSYAIRKKDFLWLKRDIPSGNLNLLVYDVPISAIGINNERVASIVRIRDSVGKKYVKGLTDHAGMITEESYAPYLSQVRIDDRLAFETRGTWELENGFMNGPFLNYAIEDKPNHRYIIVEGFVYDPSNAKRDLIFELEAIIKSIQFLNSKK
ncbi:DUF4837 family protein [Flavobacterium enshiense]|uniref:DUF4837 family protein n=1 Tax=Flavobacterium enshiense TaxID=1341165 RepID=UPI00345D51E0